MIKQDADDNDKSRRGKKCANPPPKHLNYHKYGGLYNIKDKTLLFTTTAGGCTRGFCPHRADVSSHISPPVCQRTFFWGCNYFLTLVFHHRHHCLPLPCREEAIKWPPGPQLMEFTPSGLTGLGLKVSPDPYVIPHFYMFSQHLSGKKNVAIGCQLLYTFN